MDILTLHPELRERADLVITDREGLALLIVEIKARPGASKVGIEQVRGNQRRFGFPFAMFADPAQIWLYGSPESDEPLGCFSTPETLLPYDPRFEKNRIFEDYMQGLMEGWLADYTFSWRYADPPNHAALRAIGLAGRLKGGRIDAERSS